MNYTPIRPPKSSTAVYNALQQLSHATANEIMDWSNRHTTGKPVSLTSVYRALNDGQVRYELNSNQMHHHHLVCTTCNQVEMIDTCPFETFLKTLHSQFKVEYHNFEVFGVCGNCYNTPQSIPGEEEFPSSDYTIFKRDHVIG
jgi:Fe2+ or Zn2+ uptake regulation protein